MARLRCCERSCWRLHHDAGGHVGDADGALGLVDVLAAGAAGAHGVDAEIGFLDLDVDVLVDHRIDPDRGEAGVAARLAVEGRDAHQPVHAALGLEPAIGVVAADLDGRGFDARPLRRRSPRSAPPCSHAARPSACTCAPASPAQSCASVPPAPALTSTIAVVVIGLAREQALQLALGGAGLQLLQRGLGLGDDGLVAFGLAQFDQRQRIVELALEALIGLRSRCPRCVRSRITFCASARLFQRSGSSARAFSSARRLTALIPVKDASAAARATTGSGRRVPVFRRA